MAEDTLREAEVEVGRTVRTVLREVAAEFADSVRDADELVAARFSVGSIARMWTSRVPRIVRKLLGVSETAANEAAGDVGGELDDTWRDLPGRYDDGRELPLGMGQYVETTEHLLRAVGDRLAEAARQELADGVEAGNTVDQLRDRLRARFAADGAQLGRARQERTAATEASRAWNTATLEAGRALTGPDRPLVKQWRTRGDKRVRDAHDDVDGQLRLLDEPFRVGGYDMDAPGDPAAPASLVVNCRCQLRLARAERAALTPEPNGTAAPARTWAWGGWWESASLERSAPGLGTRDAATAPGEPGHVVPVGPGDVMTTGAEPRPVAPALASARADDAAAPLPEDRTALPDAREAHAGAGLEAEERQDAAPVMAPTTDGPTQVDASPVLQGGDPLQMSDVHTQRTLTEVVEFHSRVRRDGLGPEGDRPRDVVSGNGAVASGGPGTAVPVPGVALPQDATALVGLSTHEVEERDVRAAEVQRLSGRADSLSHVDLLTRSAMPRDGARRRRGPDVESPVSHAPLTTSQVRGVTAAADGSHLMGGMIALIPTEEDAARLAIEGGEDVGELHLTLYFLGDQGGDWTEDQRNELAASVRSRLADLGGPVTARAFGANHWNAGTDSPSWVWAVGDDRDAADDAPRLNDIHDDITEALEDTHERPDLPRQHSPWVPHVCAAYSDDPALLEELEARLGPITFDRVRLAFGGDHIDISLTPEEEPMPEEESAAGMPTRSWTTPGDTALAFENETTGDGRVFVPGAISWDGAGPWPLQYADEMLSGHQGAELAGAIQTVSRDGDRIPGTGVLYLSQRAGAEAAMLLEEEAPLGVSVDLDDVDVEFVDRTLAEDEDGNLVLAASLASASLLQLEDGGWCINAHPAVEWEASAGVLSRQRPTVQLITGPGGQVNAGAIVNAFAGTGLVPDRIVAAAGEPDAPDAGVVVHAENSGDFLIRITRARLRGATLVSVPAFAGARIVLDPLEDEEEAAASARSPRLDAVTAASGETRKRVVTYVRSCPGPVGAAEVARAVEVSVSTARRHLNEAVKEGHLVRLRPGLYTGASSIPEGQEETASAAPAGAHAAVGGPHLHPVPEEVMTDLVASAWTAMQDADPMPAAWFAEPTEAELPDGSGGVHYAGGRIYGWVARAGEPHAGHPGRNLTVESLGQLDMSHFLRARFKLDDGTFVKAGAFTMNVPHSRDGAECDTAACQFDDTRTVAGVITTGLNERGLWFSGAAAPWLSAWDRTVFAACQPSYHMLKGGDGRWQLRAVLSVPVPGHSSPLIAAAVERSNLALAASAALAPAAGTEGVIVTAPRMAGDLEVAAQPLTVSAGGALVPTVDVPGPSVPATDTAVLTAALLERPDVLDRLADALDARRTARDEERRAEVERLSASFAKVPAGTTASF